MLLRRIPVIVSLCTMYGYPKDVNTTLYVDGTKRLLITPIVEPPHSGLECRIASPDIIISLMRAAFEAGKNGEDFKVLKESGALYGLRRKICGAEATRGAPCH